MLSLYLLLFGVFLMSMSRRNFFSYTTAILGLALHAQYNSILAQSRMVKKPRHLAKDMTVGLVSPASNANEDEAILASIDFVRSLGFKVKASSARSCQMAAPMSSGPRISILFSLTQRLMLFFVHGVVMVLREYLGSWTMMLSH